MMQNILKNKFPDITINGNKIYIDNNNLKNILLFLKSNKFSSFPELLTIIAIDYIEYKELIYVLLSLNGEIINLVQKVQNETDTVCDIYKSAYFDECEIYDLFGINFIGNKKLKRLLLPKSWDGHPLLKNYVINDERLIWNG